MAVRSSISRRVRSPSPPTAIPRTEPPESTAPLNTLNSDVAAIPDHYWSVSIFDARTDVAAVRSDRDTGGSPARLALVAPGAAAPAGYEAVPLEYTRGIALIRILVSGEDDYHAVDPLRQLSSCRAK